MNICMPKPASEEFFKIQDEYLKERNRERGITDLEDLSPAGADERLYIWQDDITTLKCEAIVDACNSGMLGCFQAMHSCIDNTTFCQPGYGRCIQIIRLQGGYTQEEFARLLDTDRCTVAVWECEFEERHPEPQRFGKIKKIAGDLGINLSKLVENPDSYKDEYTLFVEGDYGKKIRQIRLAAAMTYKEFAISIGCEAETLEHWEIGWQKPLRKYFDAIKEIAAKVGIELQKINDDPEYFGSQYQDFIGRECGKKVKSIRMAYGYTQDQLGQLVGCTGEAIGKWERELSVPDLNYYKCLENIAHQAGITIVQLNENPELYIDDYKDFCKPGYGKVLKHLRKQLGLRQVDFAEELGVSSATYRNWETERFIPMRENYNEIKKFVIKKGVDIS